MSNYTTALLASLTLSLTSGTLSALLLFQPNPTPQALETLNTSNQICYTASTTTLSLLSLKRRRRPQ